MWWGVGFGAAALYFVLVFTLGLAFLLSGLQVFVRDFASAADVATTSS